MINKKEKSYLYLLLDSYLDGSINASTLCDEYYYTYSLNLDYDTLSPLEKTVFLQLSRILARFSEFEDDIKKYPNTYVSEQQLKEEVLVAQKLLL